MTTTDSTKSAIPNKTQSATVKKPPVKKEIKKTGVAEPVKSEEFPVQNQIAPFSVKKKKHDKKVIRDSFSFPEQDYRKISELKKICLAAGVHVKKGEILRAGLHLLTEMNLSELISAVEKIERVKTGRPKADKK